MLNLEDTLKIRVKRVLTSKNVNQKDAINLVCNVLDQYGVSGFQKPIAIVSYSFNEDQDSHSIKIERLYSPDTVFNSFKKFVRKESPGNLPKGYTLARPCGVVENFDEGGVLSHLEGDYLDQKYELSFGNSPSRIIDSRKEGCTAFLNEE